MKNIVRALSLCGVLCLLGYYSGHSQPDLPPAPVAAPIDGGLSLLAAAGGAYACKKLIQKHRASVKETID